MVVCRMAQSFEPTLPIELWNILQWACDKMPRTNNGVEGFHNERQSSLTKMHSSIWKLIYPLVKEETLGKKNEILYMKINQQTKAYVIQWMKNFSDDKCLGTLQKIKSIIFAVLPRIDTIHF